MYKYLYILKLKLALLVVLGSNYGEIFNGYLVAARKVSTVNGNQVLGDFIGHFEPQWDAGPVCCNGVKIPVKLVTLYAFLRQFFAHSLSTVKVKYIS